jgi:hypothetical protein
MGRRYWVWLGARVLAGLIVILWAISYLRPGSAEKEFQKTLDAMKQVHSFRAAYTGNPNATQHSDILWEVDCNRGILHYQYHDVSTNPPTEMSRDELTVAGHMYQRKDDGSWKRGGYTREGTSTKWYCVNLAQGTNTNLLPDVATMIKRAILDKGDEKIVNGVHCREWKITLRMGRPELEHDSVCLGVEDHLPYEMITNSGQGHYSYSDYNTSIPFDLPDAAVQPASATAGSN